MQTLIDALLSYSRVGRGAIEPVDVDTAALVDDVLRSLQAPIAERGTRVEAGALPTLPAEPTLLWQVFQNLIANAIKITDGQRPQVRVSASHEPGRWRFYVEDNGPGIEPRHAKRGLRDVPAAPRPRDARHGHRALDRNARSRAPRRKHLDRAGRQRWQRIQLHPARPR